MLKKIKKKELKHAHPPEIKKYFIEFKIYHEERKNLFDWLVDQPFDFLNKLAELSNELINPSYPMNYGMLLVLICLKSHEIEYGIKEVEEEKLMQMSQELSALCSLASLVKAGYIMAKEESNWFKLGSSVKTNIQIH